MNNDKPRKLSIEQREQLRAAKIACPDHVARALGIGRVIDADEMLDLLRKLRDGAVTDSNRIGELSSQLDAVTKKRDDLQWHNDRKDEQLAPALSRSTHPDGEHYCHVRVDPGQELERDDPHEDLGYRGRK